MDNNQRQALREQAIKEYDQIQNHRKLWSELIMRWLGLMIGVGGILYVFSSYITWIPKCSHISLFLCFIPYLGWLLFVVPLFTWRIVSRHISRQITIMYPRLLELEHILEWEVDTIYIFNNLSQRGWQELEGQLPNINPNGPPERRNYPRYREICRSINMDTHEPLLAIWNDLGYESVGSRGHTVQDIMVGVISFVTLVITSFLAIQNSIYCLWVIVLPIVFTAGIIVCIIKLIYPHKHWN